MAPDNQIRKNCLFVICFSLRSKRRGVLAGFPTRHHHLFMPRDPFSVSSGAMCGTTSGLPNPALTRRSIPSPSVAGRGPRRYWFPPCATAPARWALSLHRKLHTQGATDSRPSTCRRGGGALRMAPLGASYSPAGAPPRYPVYGRCCVTALYAKCRARCHLHMGPLVAHASHAARTRPSTAPPRFPPSAPAKEPQGYSRDGLLYARPPPSAPAFPHGTIGAGKTAGALQSHGPWPELNRLAGRPHRP